MAATKTTGDNMGSGRADNDDNARRLFFVSALNMSWQLAIVVLLPILGGFKLDQKLGWLPVLTIIGFVIAMAGMVLIVRRQLKAFGPPPKNSPKDDNYDDD